MKIRAVTVGYIYVWYYHAAICSHYDILCILVYQYTLKISRKHNSKSYHLWREGDSGSSNNYFVTLNNFKWYFVLLLPFCSKVTCSNFFQMDCPLTNEYLQLVPPLRWLKSHRTSDWGSSSGLAEDGTEKAMKYPLV